MIASLDSSKLLLVIATTILAMTIALREIMSA